MKPIFISYSSKHRDLTRELADVIEAQYGPGSVWWDHDLESRASYSEQIRTALEGARVVVVIWTAGAMISDYVYAEAVTAQAHGKLVNVRPADMSFRDIPQPFNIHHIDDLENHDRLLSTIAKVMAGTPVATRVPLHEIYFRQHGRRLIDPKQSKLARDPREVSPTQLLQARFGVVGYLDVTGIKTGLIEWCAGSPRITAGRLVLGPGGLGKTRLMIEVAAALRQRGWTAGFLERPHEQIDATLRQRWQALDQLLAHGEDQGLLIVMDYAEARQDEVQRLAERLSVRPDGEMRPIRLVLLARSGGNWWTTLHDDTPELQILFRDTGPDQAVIELPAISTGQHRLDLFRASLRQFSPLLKAQGYVLPAVGPPPERLQRIEAGTGYSRPLAIQIEALLWLESAAQEPGDAGVDGLLRQVLGLERNHWKNLVSSLDDERTRDLARGVTQVTVVQGVPSSAATEQLLMADDFYKGHRTARAAVDPVVRALSRLYGKPDGGIGHLEPDLIGEHHVAVVGDSDLIDGCLRSIETEPADMRGKRRRDLVAVLQRASQPEHGASANARVVSLLDHLINRHVQTLAAEMVAVMVDTPGAFARRLDQTIDTLDDESLGAIDAALPIRSLSLMDLSLRVAVRRAHMARRGLGGARLEAADQHESTLNHVAACVGTLGIRLSNLGRHEEALAANREAVDIRRRLAQTRPDAFLSDLATGLNNLGTRLSHLGRREEALAVSQQGVVIYRRLAQARPDAFSPDLAMSLTNLGIRLSHLGRREEALAVSQQAVDIYRRLAQTRPDAFSPDLARSLHNAGAMLSNLGRREEALAASQQAVDIHRRLAQTRPDAFLPDLAMSLNNLGGYLSHLGRHEQALAASQQAVDIYRRLAQTRPDAFLPDLAASLSNTGQMLSHLGRRGEALAASQEAVDIYRRLPETSLAAFLPDLATSLSVTSDILASLERRVEAAQAAHHALELLAPFVERYPDVCRELARSIGAGVLRYSKAAAQTPNMELLERVARALGSSEEGSRHPAP